MRRRQMGQHHMAIDLDAHQMRLLEAGRCRRCAERVSRTMIMRGADCPHCATELRGPEIDVRDQVKAHQRRWRIVGYGLVGVASFFAGVVPLLQSVVQVVALFVLHVVVLRRGLVWLSPGRRIFARMSMKLFAATVAAFGLLINVAIAPFLGFSAFVLAVVGPVLTAVYVEGGLVIVRRCLRWEAEGRRLQTVEWLLPVVFLIGLIAVVTGMVALIAAGLHAVATVEIPTVGEWTDILSGWW